MFNPSQTENESVLILRAFILDTQIEHPELIVIAQGKKAILLSEVFAQFPAMREELIEKRAKVFRKLGLEIPDVC